MRPRIWDRHYSATDKVGGICSVRGCFVLAFIGCGYTYTDTMCFLIRGSEKGDGKVLDRGSAKHLSPGTNAA